jgi:Zn-dependent protease
MMRYGIMINLVLGIFNLIPIPPLDGSKMLAVFLPYNMAKEYESWVQYTQYLFMGLFLLSFANIGFNPFAFILYPAQALNNALAYLSLQLITLF